MYHQSAVFLLSSCALADRAEPISEPTPLPGPELPGRAEMGRVEEEPKPRGVPTPPPGSSAADVRGVRISAPSADATGNDRAQRRTAWRERRFKNRKKVRSRKRLRQILVTYHIDN